MNKRCTHWIGTERRECGSEVGIRPFLQGPRCPIHDPRTTREDHP